MSEVFFDTTGFIALEDGDDPWSEIASSVNRRLLEEDVIYVTSNFVLDEVYTLLKSRMGLNVVGEFMRKVRTSEALLIVPVSPFIEDAAWELFVDNPRSPRSFTDCTSAAIMKLRGIARVFTTDPVFEEMGFQIVLKS